MTQTIATAQAQGLVPAVAPGSAAGAADDDEPASDTSSDDDGNPS